MNAKSRADFINSVASGRKIPCPICGLANEPNSAFCYSCGSRLMDTNNSSPIKKVVYCPSCNASNDEGALFCASCGAKIEETKEKVQNSPSPEVQAFNSVTQTIVEEQEEISVFAQGLPAWDIVPPNIMVRRNKKR